MNWRSALLTLALGSAVAAEVPLFEGLGPHTRTVTTGSPEAQKYFDQGLNFVFGFQHGAAIRSFQEAARLDPHCAMAHWGISLACGPHINCPVVPPAQAKLAWSELGLARREAASASPVERALIEALSHRYSRPDAGRDGLDLQYARAMRTVFQTFPADPDVGTFFAESLMDLRPWDQWTPEGQMQPGTEEILATLDHVLQLDALHPFANHLYIHAVEASPHPERALAQADRLRTLQPGLAHNVHMASHIDIRLGHWEQAVQSNLDAVAADLRYRKVFGPPRDLALTYAAHNEHMLAYAAMMTGQSALALQHIQAMTAMMPPDFVRENAAFVESYFSMPYEVLLRFGRWDEVLAQPEPPAYMPFTRAFRRAARGVALAAQGKVPAARQEQATYARLRLQVGEDTQAGNNAGLRILDIVTPMLDGEILVREGKLEQGLKQLRSAVRAEDALRYDEPPGWILPVRHALGAALLNAKRYAEAEQVYRDDLRRLPDNGWSLFGLARSLELQGKPDAALQARFAKIWEKADLQLTSSCLCQP